MAMPSLRQPKTVTEKKFKKLENVDVQNVIVTLKGNKSLVISSDAYHGLIKGREMYRCVFCKMEMEPDVKLKESHKLSDRHRVVVESYPHVEEYAENLIRTLDKDLFYCTLCNVVVASPFLIRHITSEVHSQELGKAEMKALAYMPSN